MHVIVLCFPTQRAKPTAFGRSFHTSEVKPLAMGVVNVSHTGYMSQDSIDFSCPENLPESQELVCPTFRNKMLMVWSI